MNTPNQNDADDVIDPLSDYEPVEYASRLQRAFAEEKVDQIESQPFLAVDSKTSIRETVKRLGDSQLSSLLVVEEGKLVGVFTERDVLEKIAEQFERVAEEPVKSFMTSRPTIVYQSDPSAAAAAAIAVAGHRHVPVLDLKDNVQGIVSPRRLFQFMEQHF